MTLNEKDFDHKISITDIFKGKKGVLFGVPGAFTPLCSKTHLPGYVTQYDNLKAAGAEVIVCTSVNDPWVHSAWGDCYSADGKVRMLADPHGELAKKLGVELDMPEVWGHQRSKRYSAVIEDNKIKTMNVEKDGTGLGCSVAEGILKQLKE